MGGVNVWVARLGLHAPELLRHVSLLLTVLWGAAGLALGSLLKLDLMVSQRVDGAMPFLSMALPLLSVALLALGHLALIATCLRSRALILVYAMLMTLLAVAGGMGGSRALNDLMSDIRSVRDFIKRILSVIESLDFKFFTKYLPRRRFMFPGINLAGGLKHLEGITNITMPTLPTLPSIDFTMPDFSNVERIFKEITSSAGPHARFLAALESILDGLRMFKMLLAVMVSLQVVSVLLALLACYYYNMSRRFQKRPMPVRDGRKRARAGRAGDGSGAGALEGAGAGAGALSRAGSSSSAVLVQRQGGMPGGGVGGGFRRAVIIV